MPRVSVIIPSYNHEKYVAESIQSVLDQTYQDFEIVITDDGSSDKTIEVVKQFSDRRIKLFCFPSNQGAVIAVNHCIKNAEGEFIALLNSDDVFEPSKLEKQVIFLDNHPEIGAVFSRVQFIGEDSQPLKKVSNYENFDKENRNRFEWLNYFFYNLNCLCHPSVLIRKECYDNVGLYDPRLAQLPDFEFWLRLCQKYEIFILPERLIKFRIRDKEANASGNTLEKNARVAFELSQIFRQYIQPEVLDNISKIFPELINSQEKEMSYQDRSIAKYLIAWEAFKSKIPAIKQFGLVTLYEMLGNDSESYFDLKKLHKFNYIDFIQMTGTPYVSLTSEIFETARLIKISKLWKIWSVWTQIKQNMLRKN